MFLYRVCSSVVPDSMLSVEVPDNKKQEDVHINNCCEILSDESGIRSGIAGYDSDRTERRCADNDISCFYGRCGW